MKPRPRLRRAVARWGAVVSVVLLVVWGASAFGGVRWNGPGGLGIAIDRGRAFITIIEPHPPRPIKPMFEGWWIPRQLLWWFDWHLGAYRWFFFIPLWLPVIIALAATLTARRLDAKARRLNSAPTCPRCAYPRAGLAPGTVCPECGAPAPAI